MLEVFIIIVQYTNGDYLNEFFVLNLKSHFKKHIFLLILHCH